MVAPAAAAGGVGERLFLRLSGWAARHAVVVVVGLALVSALAAGQLLRLRVEADIAGLLPPDAETRRLIARYTVPGAVTEPFVVGLSGGSAGGELLSLAGLALVEELDQQLRALPEVADSLTPFNLLTFRSDRGRLLPAPLATGAAAPQTAAELAAFIAALEAGPPGSAVLFNRDEPALSLIYLVEAGADYRSFLRRVRTTLAAYEGELTAHLGGWLPVYAAAHRLIARDLPLLAGLAALITLLVLLASFAALRAVLLPLAAISLALLWTFGLMALTGAPVSIASLMLPPLLFALGGSYSVHLLVRYFSQAPRTSESAAGDMPRAPREAAGSASAELVQVIAAVSQTVTLAALTTAAGFASLLFSSMPRLREFGLFAAAGILMCALITLLLYPAVLARLPPPTAGQRSRISDGWLAMLVARLTRAVPRRRWWVYGLLLLLAGLFIWSLSGVRYQTDVARYFRRPVPAIEDNRTLMGRFGSFIDVNVTVTGRVDADLLLQLARFEEAVQAHPAVSHVTTLAAYLRALNQALAGTAEHPRNPVVIQLFYRLLRLGTAAGGSLGSLVDLERGHVTTRVWVYDRERRWLLLEPELRELVQFLERTAAAVFPPEREPEVWGWSLVTLRVAELLAREQVASTVISALLVLAIATAAFRSLRYGVLTVLPLATAIMLTFVLMVLLGIPLDALTMSFAGVAIGVGVDDSIHFLLHYRRAARPRAAGHSDHAVAEAVAVAMQQAGSAILLTTIAIVIGLTALLFSQFLPVVYLGVLISVTLIGATTGTLLLLPALLGRNGERTRTAE